MTRTVYTGDALSSSSGSFSATVSSLSAGTTYYYKAYMSVWNGSSYVDIESSVGTFTTSAQQSTAPSGWLELPGYTTSGMAGTTSSSLGDLYFVKHSATMGGKTQRNYSCLYDPEMYASYWVAYPLCFAHTDGSGRSEQWAYDPDVPQTKQTNAVSGAYGVSYPSENYSSNLYARGHQIANSDRNGVEAMCDQTFYMTNITTQIQNGFNGGVWANLESAVQGLTSSADTVYVVTGAAFRKKTDGSETITTIVNSRDGKTLPVPNYYWKALLKVSWSGKTVSAASAIGFWLEHREYTSSTAWQQNAVSIDQIEAWTGFDLFANLPAALQTTAEANTSWTAFQNF